MDIATVALAISIANGLAALTLRLLRINDRRRARRESTRRSS